MKRIFRQLPRVVPLFGLMMIASGQAIAGPPVFDDARASETCEETWTKRGNLDQQMYDFCMAQQTEGYAEAVYMMDLYKDIPDIENIADFAAQKWLQGREYQYDMVAFEIEQQAEAFLDVAYDFDTTKYSQAEVSDCMAQWVSDAEPQWDMVAFCLKND